MVPERKDLWWLEPLVIVVVLGTFVLYSVYAGLANANYFYDPYLSPLYSPCITANCVHPHLPIVGAYWNLSPAILIVVASTDLYIRLLSMGVLHDPRWIP